MKFRQRVDIKVMSQSLPQIKFSALDLVWEIDWTGAAKTADYEHHLMRNSY
jgi:hypothetical protein